MFLSDQHVRNRTRRSQTTNESLLITTGIVFTVITLTHIWEVIDRRHLFLSDAVVLAVSAGLALWAWRLKRASHHA